MTKIQPTKDPVITALEKRYFDIAGKENYPGTPDITAEMDRIEEAIRELKNKGKEFAA